MKSSRRVASVLPLLLLAAAPLAGQANEPILIADLSPGGVGASFYPTELTAAGGRLYMSFGYSGSGDEPWTSDGTAAGTRRLGDVCPGNCSSNPASFAAAGDRVVFTTREPLGYRTIRSLAPGGEVELIGDGLELVGGFEPLGDLLYFAARQAGQTPLLYRSDGTAAGTRPAAELCGEGAGSCETFYAPKAAGGLLFYHQGGVLHLYTPASGRQPLATLAAARLLTPFGDGRMIFEGCGANPADCSVYTTDGTAAGTLALTFSGFGSGRGDNFIAFGDRAYFRDDTRSILSTDGRQPEARNESSFGSPVELQGATASHLIYSRGNAPSIELHARSSSGIDSVLRTSLDEVAASGQTAGHFFFAYHDGEREGFGATDGSPAGTSELAERQRGGIILPPGSELEGGPAAILEGRFYFSFDPDGTQFASLWSSDGTPAGTAPIDFGLGVGFSSFPTAHRNGRAILLETASDTALWRVDPDSLAIRQLPNAFDLEAIAGDIAYVWDRREVPPAFTAVAADDTATALLPPEIEVGFTAVAADGRLYFGDGEDRVRLWESDGTPAGTRLLFDLDAVCAICARYLPAEITPSGDRVFFVGEGAGINQFALWSWQRGAAAPVSLMPLPATLDLIPAGDGRVVFALPIPFSGGENKLDLWVSDGTPAGTLIVFQLPYLALMDHWTAAGSRFFFSINRYLDPVPTSSLWVSDLTPGGSALLIEGAGSLSELAAAGDHLFFAGRTAGRGSELGFSDGTPGGSRWLDLLPGPSGSGAHDLYVLADGRLVFAAAADAAGDELWITDGTLGGSRRLADLAPGSTASSPGGMVEMPNAEGSRLFFAATDGQVGREPWALDLPPAAGPACPDDRLCLREGRFEVKAEADVNGVRHPARRVLNADESGVFSFFSGDNWELQVKVLDGCAINDALWVYAAAATDVTYSLSVHDRWSGEIRDYASGGLSRPILDSAAFATCAASALPPVFAPVPAGPAAHRCPDQPEKLCLGPQGRYRVAMRWTTAESEGAAAPVAQGSADSGLFTFFSPGNWETMVKVLDGCAINGKIWVFAAGTTDVGWKLTVEDGRGGEQVYENPLGQPSRTVADIAAFACN